MKQPNTMTRAERRQALIAARQVVIDFLGQSLADEYQVVVGEFTRPSLAFFMDGRQYTLNLNVLESSISINRARATFNPTTPNDNRCPECDRNPCICAKKCPDCDEYPCACVVTPPKCPDCNQYPCVCVIAPPKCPDCDEYPCVCYSSTIIGRMTFMDDNGDPLDYIKIYENETFTVSTILTIAGRSGGYDDISGQLLVKFVDIYGDDQSDEFIATGRNGADIQQYPYKFYLNHNYELEFDVMGLSHGIFTMIVTILDENGDKTLFEEKIPLFIEEYITTPIPGDDIIIEIDDGKSMMLGDDYTWAPKFVLYDVNKVIDDAILRVKFVDDDGDPAEMYFSAVGKDSPYPNLQVEGIVFDVKHEEIVEFSVTGAELGEFEATIELWNAADDEILAEAVVSVEIVD